MVASLRRTLLIQGIISYSSIGIQDVITACQNVGQYYHTRDFGYNWHKSHLYQIIFMYSIAIGTLSTMTVPRTLWQSIIGRRNLSCVWYIRNEVSVRYKESRSHALTLSQVSSFRERAAFWGRSYLLCTHVLLHLESHLSSHLHHKVNLSIVWTIFEPLVCRT